MKERHCLESILTIDILIGIIFQCGLSEGKPLSAKEMQHSIEFNISSHTTIQISTLDEYLTWFLRPGHFEVGPHHNSSIHKHQLLSFLLQLG